MLLVAIHKLMKKFQKYSRNYSKFGRFTLTTKMNKNIQTILGITLLLWNSYSIYANIQEFKQALPWHNLSYRDMAKRNRQTTHKQLYNIQIQLFVLTLIHIITSGMNQFKTTLIYQAETYLAHYKTPILYS